MEQGVSMIYVQCSIIDMNTNKLRGQYLKSFEIQGDFNSWYHSVKCNYDTIINVMRYNPEEFPGRKDTYDAKLLRVGRTNEN